MSKKNNQTIIEVSDLVKTYLLGKERVRALRGVDFTIGRGEIVIIVGSSGSGKSTLLNMMAGLEKPTRGKIEILGSDIVKMGEQKLAKFRQRHIGFIFQSYNLLPALTALQNVGLPLLFRGVKPALREREAAQLLTAVGLKTHMFHRPPQMSGGQQQRVGIARAFAGSPDIVFADEPTGNLDSKTSVNVMELMLKLARRKQQTMIMVTHDRSLIKYADRVIDILDGKVQSITECVGGSCEAVEK